MGKRFSTLVRRYSPRMESLSSGTTLLDGSEQTICEQGGGVPTQTSGYVDLSNLVAGDIVEVRMYIRLKEGGPWVTYHEESYSGPLTPPIVHIAKRPESHGLKVTTTQTAGVPKSIDYEFFQEFC